MYHFTHWLVATSSRGVLPVHVSTGVSEKALVENVALIIDVVCYDLKLLPYHLLTIF
jgi:hypothetical protein